MREAEAHAATHGGWTTKRHVAYPTKDVPAKDVEALAWLPARIVKDMFPGFEQFYGLKAGSLFIEDLFIAKYSDEGERLWLQQHGLEYDDKAYGVTVNADGAPIVTGWTFGALHGEAAIGGWEVFVTEFCSPV